MTCNVSNVTFAHNRNGVASAPTTLKSYNIAVDQVAEKLYMGFGDDGSGNATSIVEVGGRGAFLSLGNFDQTIDGKKTFVQNVAVPLIPLSPTDATSKEYVDSKLASAPVAGDGIHVDPNSYAISVDGTVARRNADNDFSGFETMVKTKLLTDAPGTSAASTAYVVGYITQVLNGINPGTLAYIQQLASELAADTTAIGSITASMATMLRSNLNLSDLVDKAQARINLGLGDMATQMSNAVNITGGTISNVVLCGVNVDCGYYN